ncbi:MULTISPECIES: MFS transporter [Pseudomonas]|uniref:MFS transporter n=1 Tax=Pseudomonas TaxID=286 RepID=UPI0002EA0CC2|nr:MULTISPECIES: MFS transporter [Pseudomonas]MDC7828182.1 MFS transporter [Pseudomonas benzopyrenica]
MHVANPRHWLALVAIMLAFLPVVLDMTILTVAMPTLTLALGASAAEVLWIMDIYPLLMAGLLVPMGTLADRLGNRRLLLIGLVVFGVASLLAALASTTTWLIAARVLLAFGGAMIMPCVLGIIRRTFEDEQERATALGLWSMVAAAGAALGPLIGGALLEYFWWGAVFLVNVPIMLVVAPLVLLLLDRDQQTTPSDWAPGQALLLIAGMLALIYGVKAAFGATQPLALAVPIALLGVALLSIFVRLQLHSTTPMLELSLFNQPAIVAGIAMAMVTCGTLTGVELTLAQELQYMLGKTPLQAATFMIPIMAAAALGGPLAGYLIRLGSLRWVASASLWLCAMTMALMASADLHQPGFLVPAILALLGLTLSIGLTTASIAILGSVEASKGAAAGSLEATAYELGTALGITFFGMFMSVVFAHMLELPVDLAQPLADRAMRSIGDSYIVAQGLIAPQSGALIKAASEAFSTTHSVLLMTCSAMMGSLGVFVFLMLKGCRH